MGGALLAVSATGSATYTAYANGYFGFLFDSNNVDLIVSINDDSNTLGFHKNNYRCRVDSSIIGCKLNKLITKYEKNTNKFSSFLDDGITDISLGDQRRWSEKPTYKLTISKTNADSFDFSKTIDLISADSKNTRYATMSQKSRKEGNYIRTSEGLMIFVKPNITDDADYGTTFSNYKLNVNGVQKDDMKLFSFPLNENKTLDEIKKDNFLFFPKEVKDIETVKNSKYFLVFLHDIKESDISKTQLSFKSTETTEKEVVLDVVTDVNAADFFYQYAGKDQNMKSFLVKAEASASNLGKYTCTYDGIVISPICKIKALTVDATKKTFNLLAETDENKNDAALTSVNQNSFYKLDIYIPDSTINEFNNPDKRILEFGAKIKLNDSSDLTIVADIDNKTSDNKYILAHGYWSTSKPSIPIVNFSQFKCKLDDNSKVSCKIYKLASDVSSPNEMSFASTSIVTNTNQITSEYYYLIEFTDSESEQAKISYGNCNRIFLEKEDSVVEGSKPLLSMSSSVAGIFNSSNNTENQIFYFARA